MYKSILIFLMIIYIFSEHYVVAANTAEKKEVRFRDILIKSTSYLLVSIFLSIPFIDLYLLLLDSIITLSYFVVEVIQYVYFRKSKRPNIKKAFVLFQVLHVICLAIMAYIWTKLGFELAELSFVKVFFETVNLSEFATGKWVLALLVIYKPANCFIQNLIGDYKPKEEKQEFQVDKNIGRVIGTLERIIMLVLVSIGQYSAIGLVLTAKSIARYEKISKDEKFAEYYLLGTLMSAGIVICCSVVLF